MTIGDYDEVFAMWQITSKRALSKADERGQIERYLNRNKGMSQVAVIDGKIVGTVRVTTAGADPFTIWRCCPNTEEGISGISSHKRRSKKLPKTASKRLIFSVTVQTRRVKNSGATSALKDATTFLIFRIII